MSLRARALLLGAVGCLMAQSPSDSSEIRIGVIPYTPLPTTTFRAETRLVAIPVLVRDSHDRPVSGLTKADFTVYDSNQPQTIASFSTKRGRTYFTASLSATKHGRAREKCVRPHSSGDTRPSHF